MARSETLDVAVVGAGVFGLATALTLARAGVSVRIIDRPASEPKASAVAAGMLAPVGETLAEGGDRAHLHRLLHARDLWPAFAALTPGLILDRSHTHLLSNDQAALQRMIAQLSAWGIDFSLSPPPSLGVAIGDDWRLDAPPALNALREALQALRVGIEPGEVTASADGRLRLSEADLDAGQVVIAAGHGAAGLAAAAPELAGLAPIKGQLAVFDGVSGHGGPTLHGDGLYVVPQPSGLRAGATMEPGLADTRLDPAVIERMAQAAAALSPRLAGRPFRGEAGVRAATPDGWPLVGPSVTPGVILATGARRNGWLLAPLVGRMIADHVTGAASPPIEQAMARAFHPGRFTR